MISLITGWLINRNPALTVAHAARRAKVISWALVLVLAVAAFLIWDWRDDAAAVRQANARAALETVSKAREADIAADRANDRTRNEVEQANDHARDAAENSSDPLADGLRSLR